MIRIKKIQNLTQSNLLFDTVNVSGSTTQNVLSNYSMYTQEAYRKLNQAYHQGTALFYDQNDNLITGSTFFNHWNIIANKILPYGNSCYKIYELVSDDVLDYVDNFSLPPYSIDYKRNMDQKLQVKYSFVNGFLTGATYYENATIAVDPLTGLSGLCYSNEILKVEVEYFIGDDGYVSHRKTTRSWMKMDNTYDPTKSKVTTKYYDKKQAREEGIRRRNNIIDSLIIEGAGLIVLTESISVQDAENLALPLLDDIDQEINKYIKANKDPLIQKMSTITGHTWLDNWVPGTMNTVSIRQYLISKINVS